MIDIISNERNGERGEQMEYQIDELLEKPCWIIDFLPEQVKPDADGQYFNVEYYLLNSDTHFSLKNRFVNVLFKLMCYYHVSIQWTGWIDRPSLQIVEEAVNTIMDNHSGGLNLLLPEKNVLVLTSIPLNRWLMLWS